MKTQSESYSIRGLRLLVVGNMGGTNVGQSFRWAAESLGVINHFCDASDAFGQSSLFQKIAWHCLGHRPLYINRFSKQVLAAARHFRPDLILTTGFSPVNSGTLRAIGKAPRVVLANYLTDDPWNARLRASWFFKSIIEYDAIFSPRTANLEDLRRLGCRNVKYLPFAYEPRFCNPGFFTSPLCIGSDVIFVGGGDDRRGRLLTFLCDAGVDLAIFGANWDRYPTLRAHLRGHSGPETICRETVLAKVAICLTNSGNRDQHVMRTFEIAAMRTAMVAEDTVEHRELLGDGALYFSDASELISSCKRLLADESLRQRLAASCYTRIVQEGSNTYRDRLDFILREHATIGTGKN